MASAKFTILIAAKNMTGRAIKGVKSGFGKLKGALSHIVAGFKEVVGPITAATAAVYGFVRAGSVFVRAYTHWQRAMTRLRHVLRSTGYASGHTAKELNTMADKLSRVTGVSSEAILSAETLVSTFANIKGDVFDRTIKLGMDLTAVMTNAGESVENVHAAMLQISKIVNDPVHNFGALRRIGMDIPESMKQQITLKIDQGDLHEAQMLLLGAIEKQVGGAAELQSVYMKSVAELFAAWDALKVTIGDLMTSNQSVSDGLMELAHKMDAATAALGTVQKWLNAHDLEGKKSLARRVLDTQVTPLNLYGPGLHIMQKEFMENMGHLANIGRWLRKRVTGGTWLGMENPTTGWGEALKTAQENAEKAAKQARGTADEMAKKGGSAHDRLVDITSKYKARMLEVESMYANAPQPSDVIQGNPAAALYWGERYKVHKGGANIDELISKIDEDMRKRRRDIAMRAWDVGDSQKQAQHYRALLARQQRDETQIEIIKAERDRALMRMTGRRADLAELHPVLIQRYRLARAEGDKAAMADAQKQINLNAARMEGIRAAIKDLTQQTANAITEYQEDAALIGAMLPGAKQKAEAALAKAKRAVKQARSAYAQKNALAQAREALVRYKGTLELEVKLKGIDKQIRDLQHYIDKTLYLNVPDHLGKVADFFDRKRRTKQDLRDKGDVEERYRKIQHRIFKHLHVSKEDLEWAKHIRTFSHANTKARDARHRIAKLQMQRDKVQSDQLRTLNDIKQTLVENLQAAGGA